MEQGKRKKQHLVLVSVIGMLSVLLVIQPVWSAGGGTPKTDIKVYTKTENKVELKVNMLARLESPSVIKRAHIVNPEIAELIYSETQSPQWVFVSGKSMGSTQLTLWGKDNGLLGTFEIKVRAPESSIKVIPPAQESSIEVIPSIKVIPPSTNSGIEVINGTATFK